MRRIAFGVFATLLMALAGATAANAAPVTVNLRIEGAKSTVFEGKVRTDGHQITKDATGAHPCDGTNGGANASAGPTMTSALDDASRKAGFDWSGTWSDSFQDFTVDKIGRDASDLNASKFWGYELNWKAVEIGGCQQQVESGDDVLFAYDLFSAKHVLKLDGPARARVGRPATFTVTDGRTGKGVIAAKVGGRKTHRNGKAAVVFRHAGLVLVKAQKKGSIRSNFVRVRVRR